jgi:putative DNA primase/helicase
MEFSRKAAESKVLDDPPDLVGRNGKVEAAPTPINLTDKGDGRRVVKRHGKDLHYCHPWKSWHVWDNVRWARDMTGEALRRVQETQDDLYARTTAVLKALGQDDEKDEALKARKAVLRATLAHVLKWEDWRRTTASLAHAQSEPGVAVLPEDFDRDPWAFNVLNGTLDLRTGKLRPHQRQDLITKLAPVEFHEEATCPLWEDCLERWMSGNRLLIKYLQRVIGYSLTGDVGKEQLWFLHGSGANGKSKFLGAILAMMGDYAMQAVSELLMQKSHESHPTERADLCGRRFVATIETEEGKRMAESLMKQLTGGDRMRARAMRQDFFEFPQTWKIFLAANHKPVIRGTDLATWRRIKLVPFNVTIPEAERDEGLAHKLKNERPGVLSWAVAGCVEIHRAGPRVDSAQARTRPG